ncbi:DUF4279 domain-containing protein [Amycolatopsis sp. OK19-0408]|uniref:DUF4279 domain-containing protein n=1 Tax=Amycolatopsis iheyensis TaxID=2945988 RepID=A0A9X2NLK4_9PSEU|nr:DUF4279 domain-containing protein [Amycolatopsis iheyensis]MCR6489035.1 DUF4279 domain-containing protein [Amycolatopsis iheyensis]
MRTAATFRLHGPPAEVTRRLGVRPSTATDSLWCLTSPPSDSELAVHLTRLLDVLEPHRAALWELAEAGHPADWFCLVASHATEHAVELDRRLLGRLLTLPGELLLDVCGDERD